MVDIPSPRTAAAVRQEVKEKINKKDVRPQTIEEPSDDQHQQSVLMQFPPPPLPQSKPPDRKMSPIKGYEDWEKRLNAKEKELQNREKLTKKPGKPTV